MVRDCDGLMSVRCAEVDDVKSCTCPWTGSDPVGRTRRWTRLIGVRGRLSPGLVPAEKRPGQQTDRRKVKARSTLAVNDAASN